MNASLLTRTKDSGQSAVQRLRDVSWAIVQASAAAGLAWYIAHDLLGHSDPFFAPITAAVTLSASNVFHAQRVIQNICGVALGIGVGAGVQLLLGREWAAMSVAVLVALCVSVLIGQGFIAQGLTFANQTAGSAVLVMAITGGDGLFQRLQEALIGGALALALSLMFFPADPVTLLRDARAGLLDALRDVLAQAAPAGADAGPATPDRPYTAADRVHERLDELIEARYHARLLVRVAPVRWRARAAVDDADRQAARLTLLAGSVLHLARAVTPAYGGTACIPPPVREAIDELAAGLALADFDVEAATARATAACGCGPTTGAAVSDSSEGMLAHDVRTCADDLRRVIELRR